MYETRTANRYETCKDCCALRILEAQPDFANEISLLEQVIREAGHQVIFCPKFHYELNYIEYFWVAVKRYIREKCVCSFQELESTALAGLDSISLKTICRFAMRSQHWMLAYINGLIEEQREIAEKQYKSHGRETRHVLV